MNYITERALTFTWNCIDGTEKQVKELSKVLTDNKIYHHIYSGIDCSFCPFEFTVLRSGKTWNYIMALINNIRSAKYRYKTTTYYEKGNYQITEVTFC